MIVQTIILIICVHNQKSQKKDYKIDCSTDTENSVTESVKSNGLGSRMDSSSVPKKSDFYSLFDSEVSFRVRYTSRGFQVNCMFSWKEYNM